MNGLPLFLMLSAFGADSEWNGLGAFLTTAEEARVSVKAVEQVLWSEQPVQDALVLVATDTSENVESLVSFMKDGGAVIYFAEGEPSQLFLKKLGLRASPIRSGIGGELYENHPKFPIFPADMDDTLFFNMSPESSPIVANHPVLLEPEAPGVWRSLLPRNEGLPSALVLERRVGRGWLLVIGDSSLVIREMQRFHGNKQFLANALRRYCVREPCRVTLARPQSTFVGQYQARGILDGGSFGQMRDRILEILDSISAEHGWRALNGVLAALLVWLVLWAGRMTHPANTASVERNKEKGYGTAE